MDPHLIYCIGLLGTGVLGYWVLGLGTGYWVMGAGHWVLDTGAGNWAHNQSLQSTKHICSACTEETISAAYNTFGRFKDPAVREKFL